MSLVSLVTDPGDFNEDDPQWRAGFCHVTKAAWVVLIGQTFQSLFFFALGVYLYTVTAGQGIKRNFITYIIRM